MSCQYQGNKGLQSIKSMQNVVKSGIPNKENLIHQIVYV